MKEKFKKPLNILLTFSLVSVIFGILFLLFACNGECGSDIHGGLWTWVCPKFYVPTSVCIILIVVGAIGVFASIILLSNVSKFKHSRYDYNNNLQDIR